MWSHRQFLRAVYKITTVIGSSVTFSHRKSCLRLINNFQRLYTYKSGANLTLVNSYTQHLLQILEAKFQGKVA